MGDAVGGTPDGGWEDRVATGRLGDGQPRVVIRDVPREVAPDLDGVDGGSLAELLRRRAAGVRKPIRDGEIPRLTADWASPVRLPVPQGDEGALRITPSRVGFREAVRGEDPDVRREGAPGRIHTESALRRVMDDSIWSGGVSGRVVEEEWGDDARARVYERVELKRFRDDEARRHAAALRAAEAQAAQEAQEAREKAATQRAEFTPVKAPAMRPAGGKRPQGSFIFQRETQRPAEELMPGRRFEEVDGGGSQGLRAWLSQRRT